MAAVRAKMGLAGVGDAANIHCPSCNFIAVSHAQFSVHALGHLQDRRAVSNNPPARWPAPFKRPSIGTCCKPADWANFMAAWERYRVGSNVTPDSAVYEFIECLSEELRTATTHAHPNILNLGIDKVVRLSKSTAVIPVSICVRRSEALSCKQKMGETFRHFSISVRGAVTDCDFTVPCPHASAGRHCAIAGCNGVDYTDSVVRNILLAGIYDTDIRRDVLSDPSMASKSINDIISVIESKESARDAVSSPAPHMPAPEAAASFKSCGKPPSAAAPPRRPRPQPQQIPTHTSHPLLPGATPRRLRCACGEFFMDFAQYQSGEWNATPHTCCKACHLRNKSPRKRFPKPRLSPPRKHPSAATLASTYASLCPPRQVPLTSTSMGRWWTSEPKYAYFWNWRRPILQTLRRCRQDR